MGALLAVLSEVFEISAITGLSADAILSGEAFTTAELLSSHISNLVVYGGLTEAEALAASEVSVEAFEALTGLTAAFPAAFKALAVGESLAVASIVASAAAAAALYNPGYDSGIPVATLNMAVQEWRPLDLDLDFPGVLEFTRFVNYINPAHWAGDLFHQLNQYFWDSLRRESQRQIGHATRELAHRTAHTISDSLARYFETARWVVSQLPASVYDNLRGYYRELPPLTPPQIRDVARRLKIPEPGRKTLDFTDNVKSGTTVHKYEAPGGAHQRVAPDWLLPLLLGLYGDITPSWEDELDILEKQNVKRTQATDPTQVKTRRQATVREKGKRARTPSKTISAAAKRQKSGQ